MVWGHKEAGTRLTHCLLSVHFRLSSTESHHRVEPSGSSVKAAARCSPHGPRRHRVTCAGEHTDCTCRADLGPTTLHKHSETHSLALSVASFRRNSFQPPRGEQFRRREERKRRSGSFERSVGWVEQLR